MTGGPFTEHESSVLSGQAIMYALEGSPHEITSLRIHRNGNWSLPPEKLKEEVDLVFVAMHGKYGEDGALQDFLDELGVNYTASGALTSALAINKVLTGRLFRSLGFYTPRFEALERHDSGHFSLDFDFPVIVKPVNRGLSLGVAVARGPEELNQALHRAFEFSKSVLVEEYVSGRELNVSVIESDGELIPLVPMEVTPRSVSFHDYYLKHSPEAAEVITPATLSQREEDLVVGSALLAHRAVGARGVSKTDMILSPDGRLYLLEINTIPSFIPTGALAKAAADYGLSLGEVCERIIESALDYDSVRTN